MNRKKLGASILAGLLYWITTYLMVKYERLFINSDLVTPITIYAILPLMIGFILMKLLNEINPSGILYCTMVIFSNELMVMIDDAVFLPNEYNLLTNTFSRFGQVTIYSWLLAVVGGLLAIRLNIKKGKKVRAKRRDKPS